MDIRTLKTKNSIKEAFLSLRARNSIEKIKANELCKIAQINKTTFYRYYPDVYALAEDVENEMIEKFMEELNARKTIYEDPHDFFLGIDTALNKGNIKVKEVIFSDQVDAMFDKLEKSIKEQYLAKQYTLQDYVTLTFIIGGAFNVFLRFYKDGTKIDVHEVYSILGELVKKVMD